MISLLLEFGTDSLSVIVLGTGGSFKTKVVDPLVIRSRFPIDF